MIGCIFNTIFFLTLIITKLSYTVKKRFKCSPLFSKNSPFDTNYILLKNLNSHLQLIKSYYSLKVYIGRGSIKDYSKHLKILLCSGNVEESALVPGGSLAVCYEPGGLPLYEVLIHVLSRDAAYSLADGIGYLGEWCHQ